MLLKVHLDFFQNVSGIIVNLDKTEYVDIRHIN